MKENDRYIVSRRIIDDRHKMLSKRSEFKLLRFPPSKIPWSDSKIVFDYHHQPSLNHLWKQCTLFVHLSRYLYHYLASRGPSILSRKIQGPLISGYFIILLCSKILHWETNQHDRPMDLIRATLTEWILLNPITIILTIITRTKIKQNCNKLNIKREKFGN